jgi:hypothetical protein
MSRSVVDRAAARWLAIVVVVVAVGYLPFLDGGRLTDDFVHLEHARQSGRSLSLFASADPFGFYRPLPQATYLLEQRAVGGLPAAARGLNLLLHLVILLSAFFAARMLLNESRAALLATIAFALTPKAPPIAVLWVSARADLLMSLFVFLALLAWIRWERSGGMRWFVLACACYILAFASKETAALLPLVLLFVPSGRSPFSLARVASVAPMVALGLGLLAVRIPVGALMPSSSDSHYDLISGFDRWIRSTRNYFGRALPSPLALVAAMAGAGWLDRRRTEPERQAPATFALAPLAMFAAVWFLAFLAPVMPIVARSELYLYLPGFGLCLLAAGLVQRLSTLDKRGPFAVIALTTYVTLMGGYQLGRVVGLHHTIRFSERFVAAVGSSSDVRRSSNILIWPADETTDLYLRDSIGGYFNLVLNQTVGGQKSGRISSDRQPGGQTDAILECSYRDGNVLLRPVIAAGR